MRCPQRAVLACRKLAPAPFRPILSGMDGTPKPAPAAPPTKQQQLALFVRQCALIAVIFGVWLFIGMLGYHVLDGCNWVDSFLYASLLIADEGPSYPHRTDEAKIFVGVYSLCNVIIFLSTISVFIAPKIKQVVSAVESRSNKSHH